MQYTPYGASNGFNPYAPAPTTDGMATAAMVCSIAGLLGALCGFGGIAGLVGLILGSVSLGRIKRTGARGRGMAITGIVVGAVAIVAGIAYLAWMLSDSSSYYD